MREFFKITTGNLYHDPQVESMVLYYDRQLICYVVMLVGAICLLYALV